MGLAQSLLPCLGLESGLQVLLAHICVFWGSQTFLDGIRVFAWTLRLENYSPIISILLCRGGGINLATFIRLF